MLKTLLCVFLLWHTSLAYDICRKRVALTSGTTCGLQQTMFHEGECLCCYYDKNSIPTIGIGFNLMRNDAARILAKYRLNRTNVLNDCVQKTTNNCLTDTQAKDMFNTITYPEFAACIDRSVPDLPTEIRAAAIDVSFTKGCTGFNRMTAVRTALQQGNWTAAANALRSSPWSRNVQPSRSNSDYNCLMAPTTTTITTAATRKVCTGESCNNFATPCSSNSACYCFTIKTGGGFCGPNFNCSKLPDCSVCSPSTSVCLTNTCCFREVCVPLSSGDACKNPPTNGSLSPHRFFAAKPPSTGEKTAAGG